MTSCCLRLNINVHYILGQSGTVILWGARVPDLVASFIPGGKIPGYIQRICPTQPSLYISTILLKRSQGVYMPRHIETPSARACVWPVVLILMFNFLYSG